MTDIRQRLAERIALTLDSRMGVLEPQDPTVSDFETADAILATFDVTERTGSDNG